MTSFIAEKILEIMTSTIKLVFMFYVFCFVETGACVSVMLLLNV